MATTYIYIAMLVTTLVPVLELTSSSPSRILLSLSLDATAIIPALVSDFGKH